MSDDIRENIQKHNETAPNNEENVYNFESAVAQPWESVPLTEFLKKDLPPLEFIAKPWLTTASISIIHAQRGVGKTHFSLSLAVAISLGKTFLRWQIEKPYNVLFVDGEMSEISLQNRLKDIINRIPGPIDTIPNLEIISKSFIKNRGKNLGDRSAQLDLIAKIKQTNAQVVILDNISSLVQGVIENDQSSWEPLLQFQLELRFMGVTVLSIMHSGKGEKLRGSSKVEDIVNSTIFLKNLNPSEEEEGEGDGEKYCRVKVIYQKYRDFWGADTASFEAHLLPEEGGPGKWEVRVANATKYESVLTYIHQGFKRHEICDLAQVSKGTLSKYIKKAKEQKRKIKHLETV